MWYVIQTITGKEQELVNAIEHVLEGATKEKTYKRCFVLYRECVWRIKGQLRVHIEPLFPSYVFAETEDPDEFYMALKKVPKLSKLLGSEGSFWALKIEEEQFFCSMLEVVEQEKENEREYYLVHRSLVKTDCEGKIIDADGVLKNYLDKIVKQRLRKRSVIIEIPFMRTKRRVQLGICLEGDLQKK